MHASTPQYIQSEPALPLTESYLTEMSRPQTAPTMGPVCAVVDIPSLSLSDGRVDGSGLEAVAASVWLGPAVATRYRIN